MQSKTHFAIHSCWTLKQLLRSITKCCCLICMCSRNTKKAVNAPLPSLQVLIHCYWIRPISLQWIHIIPLCLVPQSCVQSIHFPPWPYSKVFLPFVQKPVKYIFTQYMQKKTHRMPHCKFSLMTLPQKHAGQPFCILWFHPWALRVGLNL